MSLRFRISDYSGLGMRLRSLPEDQRRAVFEAVVTRGLDMLESAGGGASCDSTGRALERVESRLARIEAILADGHRLGRDAVPISGDHLDDRDIRRLVGTLHALSAH